MDTCKHPLPAISKICVSMLVLAALFGRSSLPVFAVSSWNPTLFVSTESFHAIDAGDGTTPVDLRFGSATSSLKLLTTGKFQFSKSVSVLGGISGSYLTIDGQANFSGALVAKTSITSKASLSGATFAGANLGSCNNAATQKLMYNYATQKFECGTDQTGGSSGGLGFATAENIYVNQKGDTMTGALRVDVLNGNLNTLGLRVANTASGAHIHAEKNLTSSGALVVEGNLTFGDAIGDALTINAGTWTFVNAASFVVTNAANAFSIDTDTFSLNALDNRIGIRTTAPETPLEVVGTISGTSLRTSNGASHSGSLALESSLTGATLAGFGLTDCDTAATSKLLYDLTTKKFSCGTDQTGAGGGASLTRIAGNSGAAGADMTWQNLTSNSADCTTVALCAAIMTTTGVGAGTWKFKYTLIYQTAATATGIGFGVNHTGTAGQFQAMWTHITTGGAAATGVGDNDSATVVGQMAEGKHEGVLNAVLGSASAGVAVANSDIVAVLEGIIVVTGSGNLELKIGSEVAGSAVRVIADSTLELVKIE